MKSFKDHVKSLADIHRQRERLPILYDIGTNKLVVFSSRHTRNLVEEYFEENLYIDHRKITSNWDTVFNHLSGWVEDGGRYTEAEARHVLSLANKARKVPINFKPGSPLWSIYGVELPFFEWDD